jgi:hypothetical protein
MAFEPRSLTRISSSPYGVAVNGNQVSKYFYATEDAAATVLAAGYFNANRANLHVNDLIECMCVAAGVGDWILLVVLTVPAGNITTGTIAT